MSSIAVSVNRQLSAAQRHLNILSASPSLASPMSYLEQKKTSLELLKNRMVAAQTQILSVKKQNYISQVSKLDAMSPLKVLTRGYSMVQTEKGSIVRSASQVEVGDRLTVSLHQGKIGVTVMEKQEDDQ